MKWFRHLLVLGFASLLVFSGAAVSLGATVGGTVTNASGQTGRIFLRVLRTSGEDSMWGVSLASAGAYQIRGVPNGSYVVAGFVDKNNDGVPSISEGNGMSEPITVSGDTVTGLPNLTLTAPAALDVVPQPVSELQVMPLYGGALLSWDTPQDDETRCIEADSYRIEWSTNNFTSIAGYKTLATVSGGKKDNIFMVTPLTNNTTYYFRVKSVIGAQQAVSSTVSTKVAAPVGGYSVSGKISLPSTIAVPVNTPIIVMAEGLGGQSVYIKILSTFVNGTTFTVAGIPNGYYHLHALVDMNKDYRPSAGDYITDALPITVSGLNITGKTLTVAKPNATAAIEIEHIYDAASTPSQYYIIGAGVESVAKRPVNVYVTGPQYPEGVDLAWDFDEEGVEAFYGQWADTKPPLTDVYSFAIKYSDGTTQTLYASPTAAYDNPVANSIVPSGVITTMPANITWVPSTTVPTGWVAEVEIWGNNVDFNWEYDSAILGSTKSVPYDGPALAPGSYTAEVELCEDWNWNCVTRKQVFSVVLGTVGTPASITVPTYDADGAYLVKWGASATAGVTYVLQEATNSLFTTGVRTAYSGTGTSVNITGRSQNVTYYYRVRAVKTNYTSSAYRTAVSGCAVPGAITAGVPSSITVPAYDADGAYLVKWGASATAGVTYELLEATNSLFTTGVRVAYRGTALSASIAGRSQNVTYYYQVRAVKAGCRDSAYRAGTYGCAVPGTITAGTPASITVPAYDADGVYSVTWGASATAGVTYELQEASNSLFTTGLRTAYRGTALSASITGRSQNVTYYYRVRAVKPGCRDSAYRAGAAGCAVPGTVTVAAPASITVPATDADGAYNVSWGASATAGVTYELQEATNSTFTAGLRSAYRGTATTVGITGRALSVTYYYRVRAVKAGCRDSVYRTAGNGCRIGT